MIRKSPRVIPFVANVTHFGSNLTSLIQYPDGRKEVIIVLSKYQASQIQAVGNVAGDPGFLTDFNEISRDQLLEGLAAAARDELVAATAGT